MLRLFFKTLFWLMVLSTVTVAALLYFLPRVVPQEKIRAPLEETYARVTHRKMVIGGPVEIAFLPQSYVKVSKVTFSDPAAGDVPPYTVQSLRVQFDLKEALLGRVAITFNGMAEKAFSGTAKFPTAARFNSGKEDTVELALKEPFLMQAKGEVQGNPKRLSIRKASVRFTETQGSGELEGLKTERGDSFKGELQFATLNVDEVKLAVATFNAVAELFRPAATAEKKLTEEEGQPEAMHGSAWPDEPFHLAWIATTSADIALTAEKLIYAGVAHEQVHAKLEAKNGQFSAAINQAKLFGGEGSASLLIDVTAGVPFFRKAVTLRSANVGQFLRDVYQLDHVQGTGDANVEATAVGYSWRDIVSTMAGKGSITLKDGLLQGVDILGMANPTPEVVRKAFYEGENDTKIIDASATFSMTEGILANNDLVMNVPFLRLTGRGTIDFLELSIKYKVTPIVGVEKIGLSVPLLISGSLAEPSVLPDVAGIVTQGMDEVILEAAPVRAVTDTVGEGLKAVPGVKELLDVLPGSAPMREPEKKGTD